MERCKNFGLKFAFGIAVCLWPGLAADSAAGCCSLTDLGALGAPFHSHFAMSINVNKTITVTCSWEKGKDMSGVGGERDEKDEQPTTTLDLVSCSSSWKTELKLHDPRAGIEGCTG